MNIEENNRKTLYIVSGVSFLLSFLLSICVLYKSFPAEDAFILWKYVENFVSGKGIVFFSGGPHAEGATDFLWFSLLSGLSYIGLDVAVASALLNSVGAAIITAVILNIPKINILGNDKKSNKEIERIPWWIILSSIVVVITPPAIAGYLGFSVMLYGGLCLMLIYLSLKDDLVNNLLIPITGLILTLLRPEAVILAGGFWIIGLFKLHKHKMIKKYLIITTACCIGGLVYFFWRYNYFGHFYPLPYYVKHDGAYHGSLIKYFPFPWLAKLLDNMEIKSFYLRWFRSPQGGFPVILFLILLGTAIKTKVGSFTWSFKASFLPYLFWFVSLMFVYQAQNIFWRYQTPLYMFFFYLLILFTYVLTRHITIPKIKNIFVAGALISLLPTICFGQSLLNNILTNGGKPSYLTNFSISLGKVLPENTKVAVTEAGNLAYWGKYEVYDLVGLNEPHIAVHRLDLNYLNSLDPEIIEVDISGLLFDPKIITVDANAVLARLKEINQSRNSLVKLNKGFFEKYIHKEYMEYYRKGEAPYEELKVPRTTSAAVIISSFLSNNLHKYEIYAVKPSMLQLYAIKRTSKFKEIILKKLNESIDSPQYISYAGAKNFLGAI